MTDPWVQLASESAIDRLEGARKLASKAEVSVDDLRRSRVHLRQEPDYLVRRILTRLTDPARISQKFLPLDEPGTETEPDVDQAMDVRAAAVSDVTQMLLHELRPLIGRLATDARLDVADFEQSRTRRNIDRIRSLLETITRYGEAAAPADNEQFDLTEMITATVNEDTSNRSAVTLGRSDPLVVVGDWGLVEIAFLNGLRNAGEATNWLDDSIVINWSKTDRDYWISILDNGPGIHSDPELAFIAGRTTKSKATNHGWGLTNARRAITSAGGTVKPTARGHLGARYEIRWPYPKGFDTQ